MGRNEQRSLLIMEFMINDVALRIPGDFDWTREPGTIEEERPGWNSLLWAHSNDGGSWSLIWPAGGE